jgi:hypothetical protein
MSLVGKEFTLKLERSYYFLLCIFSSIPHEIIIKINEEKSNGIYLIDIFSNNENILNRRAKLLKNNNNLRVFVQTINPANYFSIGYIIEQVVVL